jgi:hypothetical protein
METQKLDIEKKRKAAQKLDILEKRKKTLAQKFSSIKSFNICISVRIGFPIVQREPLKEMQDEISVCVLFVTSLRA